MSQPPQQPEPGPDGSTGPRPSDPAAPVYGPVPRYGPKPVPHAEVPLRPPPYPVTGQPAPAVPSWQPVPPGPATWVAPGRSSAPLRHDYAPWIRRVGGMLIDQAPGFVASALVITGYLPLYASMLHGDFTARPNLVLVLVGTLLSLASLGWTAYNRWVLAGRTGQSVGKKLTRTWLVSERTARPIGTLNAFLRDLLHTLDGFAYVGYLWPLWDERRQTFADKIIETVVVRTPAPPLQPWERPPT